MLQIWEKMLAKRAYEKRWLSRRDLEKVLRQYFREKGERSFSQLLVELQFLTEEQLQTLEGEVRKFLKGSTFQPSEDTFLSAASETQMLRSLWFPQLTHYDIIEPLAEGGMGQVFRARDRRSHKVVALKVLKDRDPENQRRFLREIKIARALQHRNILPILDFGQEREWIYFTMPLIDGEDLDDWVYRRGPLSPLKALKVLLLVGDAVRYAHTQGVIHRDLKPSNILIDKMGTPLLTDFGLAKNLVKQTVSITRTGTLIGTPEYMSPEQARGEVDQIDYTSDIYGLGAILYFCLSARPPFEGENLIQTLHKVAYQEPVSLKERRPDLPDEIVRLCHKCLAKDPKDRFPSVERLLQEVQKLARSYSHQSSHEITKQRPPSFSRRKWFFWALLLLILVGLGAALFFYWPDLLEKLQKAFSP